MTALFPHPDISAAAMVARPLRLGFLCPHNPLDPRAFSGTAFFAARALAARADVSLRILGPWQAPTGLGRIAEAAAWRLGRRPRRPCVDVDGLDLQGLDAIVGLVATPLLDTLSGRSDLPFLHVTDATPAFLRETYGRDVTPEDEAAEAWVAARSAATVYSSHYMAARAEADLGVAAGRRACVLPFGVNLDAAPSRHRRAPCETGPAPELLFVCSDWVRKGGQIALDALAHLRARGIDAHLTIVGRVPPHVAGLSGVRVAGYLDKRRPSQARRLADLYDRADLMILPTRADCTPMVVAEALARGTPVLATDTGGMATLLGRDGACGGLVAQGDDGGDWARHIAALLDRPDRLAVMRRRARTRTREVLNWDAWAEGIAALAREAIADVPRGKREARAA